MGCVSSKQATSVTPAIDHSGLFRANAGSGLNQSGRIGSEDPAAKEKKAAADGRGRRRSSKKSNALSESGTELGESGRSSSLSFRLGNLTKYLLEGEQAAAGWPAWLSAFAGEAIHGWVPLRSDAYEKLEKIGQGTYSSVFRACEHETGRIVALKKVQFDNYDPESVRFMAREILILRRLNHPNIIKLEGIITSRLSCNIYLVFEYMEHDVTGLLSCPNIKFTESQIKCYMKQLLSGLDHCHSRGIMHRDIKGSNLLVNNEGILKVADFGLANFCVSGQRHHPLTSRVVTLWYRPPELLLGSTDYGTAVDLWSVGCVFAELLLGKPILQGTTEVEQLHKIFKLCGTPPDDYWKKLKLPHATLFKPQQRYDSCLRETLKDLPMTAVNLIEALLAIEPRKRGSASFALVSEYFSTEPYACDPSSLPVYPPSKEIDAKDREEAMRKKISVSGRTHGTEMRKLMRKPLAFAKLAPLEVLLFYCLAVCFSSDSGGLGSQIQGVRKRNDHFMHIPINGVQLQKPSDHGKDKASHVKNASQGDIPFPGPLQLSISSGFAWAKRRKDRASIRSHHRSLSRCHIYNLFEPSAAFNGKNDLDSKRSENGNDDEDSKSPESYEMTIKILEQPDASDASDDHHSHSPDLSLFLYQKEEMAAKMGNLVRL